MSGQNSADNCLPSQSFFEGSALIRSGKPFCSLPSPTVFIQIRTGDVFTGYSSTDGANWTKINSVSNSIYAF